MKTTLIAKLKKAMIHANDYLNKELFCKNTPEIPNIKTKGFHALQITVLSLQKFKVDQCPLRASALTFYSLLAIVPVAAMAFGIAKGFGLEKRFEQDLYLQFSGHKEVLNFVINFARSLLNSIKGGVIAGIGIPTLLLSVVKVLNHIESAFNLIWGVKSRKFDRKFSDYLAIMLTGPLLFTIASSVTVFIKAKVETITANTSIMDLISPIIFFGLHLLPYILIWILFTMVYMIMPNSRVRFKSAFLAGLVAGTLYQLSQTAYINFQVFVANYNAVYGSFAALPLFMIWLQISWLILLLGAEISNTHHMTDRYGCVSNAKGLSFNLKKTVALQIVHLLVKRFEKGELPATVKDMAQQLMLPIRLVQEVTIKLADSGLISPTLLADRHTPGYQPARSIQTLSIQTVISALEQSGDAIFKLPSTRSFKEISHYLNKLTEEIQNSKANCLLKDL
jgi:membrane protein